MVKFACLSEWIELCVYIHVFFFLVLLFFWWFVFVVVFTNAQGPTQTPLCYLQPWVEAGMVDAIGAPPGAGVWYSPVQLLLKVGTVLRYGVSHQPTSIYNTITLQTHYLPYCFMHKSVLTFYTQHYTTIYYPYAIISHIPHCMSL